MHRAPHSQYDGKQTFCLAPAFYSPDYLCCRGRFKAVCVGRVALVRQIFTVARVTRLMLQIAALRKLLDCTRVVAIPVSSATRHCRILPEGTVRAMYCSWRGCMNVFSRIYVIHECVSQIWSVNSDTGSGRRPTRDTLIQILRARRRTSPVLAGLEHE